jgi:hypothetical protein
MFGLAEESPLAVNSAPTPRMLGGPAIELPLTHTFRHPLVMQVHPVCFLSCAACQQGSRLLTLRGLLKLAFLGSTASKNESLRIMSRSAGSSIRGPEVV